MKTTNRLFTLIVLFSLISSCNKDKMNEDIYLKAPGSFSLTRIESKKSANLKSTQSTSSNVFDFGDIKASKEFYFLLSNSGDEPIFDISLIMDNSSFNINPKTIDYLSGEILLREESSGIIPLITLGITHGINLNGVGYSELLPMGENNSRLEIKGKTIDKGDTIEIVGNFDFSAYSRVMDIELYEDTTKINLESPSGSMSTNLGGLGFMRYYSASETSNISVKNTGNVSIDLYYGDTKSQNQMVTLNHSDSVSIDLSDIFNVIVLDSKGTITENSRIQLGDTGKGYIAIVKENHQ